MRVVNLLKVLAFVMAGLPSATAIAAAPAASGFDCGRAGNPMERRICADPKLRKAEAEMGAAYFGLLRSIDDRDMRDAIIMSQRRWLKERVKTYGALKRDERADDELPNKDSGFGPNVPLMAAIEGRRVALTRRDETGELAMIAAMVEQRRFLERSTGGPYQGFSAECGFIPKPFYDQGYLCDGTSLLQLGSRVCGTSTSWATGRNYDRNIIMDVAARGTKTTGAVPLDSADTVIEKLDPDIRASVQFTDADLHRCLTDPNYPDAPADATTTLPAH